MSPYFQNCIHTLGDGTPIERPERIGKGASKADRVAFTLAAYRYNDRVYDAANAAFVRAFRGGV